MTNIEPKSRVFLPDRAIRAARAIKNRIGLRAAHLAPILVDNMRPAHALALDAWLCADYPGWDEDHAAIARLVGDQNLSGGVNPGDRRALYRLVRALKPRGVLEIGTHIGMSSFYIAAALKWQAGADRLTTVDIIDVNAANAPWRAAGYTAAPSHYMQTLGCGDRAEFIKADSLSFMAATNDRFDLIFLDGSHAAVSIYRELAAATQILNPGGVILLHDYFPGGQPLWPDGQVIPGPWLAFRRIGRETPGIMAWPLGALPWPTKQGSRMTSLALVSRL